MANGDLIMEGLHRRSRIDFVERNIHGAWVIYGDIGIRQYYFYTKSQAMEKYREECSKKGSIVCQPA